MLAGLAGGFGAGLGFGATGTVTVLVIVCVVLVPEVDDEAPTQTVTEPEPTFEPWLTPGPDDPVVHAIAVCESNPTSVAATRTLAKPILSC
jgi:hypothetical protein